MPDTKSPAYLARVAFMDACKASELMEGSFPRVAHRTCVCQAQMRRALRTSEPESIDWAVAEAEIKENGVILTEDEARLVYAGSPKEDRSSQWAGRPHGGQNAGIVSEDGRTLRIGFPQDTVAKIAGS